MSVFWIMLVAAIVLFLGGRFYAPLIARVLGERSDRRTPAVMLNDGRDYVPSQTPVVFAHHYASIAGAGPIVGPVIAIIYGWGPALLWILLGGVFLGAVHDFVATHIAVREGGKNLAVVTRRYIGRPAFVMMLAMLVALLVLVCAAFLDLSAQALTSQVPLQTLHLSREQTLFRTTDAVAFTTEWSGGQPEQDEDALLARLRAAFAANHRELSATASLAVVEPGRKWRITEQDQSYLVEQDGDTLRVWEKNAHIGGIASMSVVIITLFSPLIGFLYLKRKIPVWICSLLAIVICGMSIAVGLVYPIPVSPLTWKLLISGYVLISAGLPVWLFLQSRDFINVHILYLGIAFLIVALVTAALRGGGETAAAAGIPLSNWTQASADHGPGWPVLFVLIACGAVSGFHSLCAGGTTCKQLKSEAAARHVGYYSMLLESFLAVCVVCCLIVGLSMADYVAFQYPPGQKGNAVQTFAVAVGATAHHGLNIPTAFGTLGGMLLLEGFLVTTLDTAIRLTRYMIEEGWGTFFGRYDVFATTAAAQAEPVLPASPARGATELVGTGGLTAEKPFTEAPVGAGVAIGTRGPLRWLLKFLRQYWVNSGIAVGLMLLLGLHNGYNVVWKIFGSSNQLLAALTLIVATCWLIAHRRPVWYTLLPALFMLATAITALVRELVVIYIPGWPGQAPLAITAIVVLVVTAGIIACAVARWAAAARTAPVAP